MPEARALSDRLAVVRADLAGFASGSTATLTTAELRVLQFLPTHLNFRAIAEQTGVSANTIKTQANAVYRKLVVRSRFEAVERARELGLLDA
jgi:LuxR family maltose regulon positive regulatory protein